ncbi:MAG: hypothetical protein R3C11_16310 [Planctomycetaceae bacterium]
MGTLMQFFCQNCDKPIRVPDRAVGKRLTCKRCGEVQRVPTQSVGSWERAPSRRRQSTRRRPSKSNTFPVKGILAFLFVCCLVVVKLGLREYRKFNERQERNQRFLRQLDEPRFFSTDPNDLQQSFDAALPVSSDRGPHAAVDAYAPLKPWDEVGSIYQGDGFKVEIVEVSRKKLDIYFNGEYERETEEECLVIDFKVTNESESDTLEISNFNGQRTPFKSVVLTDSENREIEEYFFNSLGSPLGHEMTTELDPENSTQNMYVFHAPSKGGQKFRLSISGACFKTMNPVQLTFDVNF